MEKESRQCCTMVENKIQFSFLPDNSDSVLGIRYWECNTRSVSPLQAGSLFDRNKVSRLLAIFAAPEKLVHD